MNKLTFNDSNYQESQKNIINLLNEANVNLNDNSIKYFSKNILERIVRFNSTEYFNILMN